MSASAAQGGYNNSTIPRHKIPKTQK